MPRNKTLFIYNTTKNTAQEWTIYAEGAINQTIALGQVRKSFRLSLNADVVLQFGVEDTVYLKATYDYDADTWTSHTDTPKEFEFSAVDSAINASSSYMA